MATNGAGTTAVLSGTRSPYLNLHDDAWMPYGAATIVFIYPVDKLLLGGETYFGVTV
jgi:hypothetical protein